MSFQDHNYMDPSTSSTDRQSHSLTTEEMFGFSMSDPTLMSPASMVSHGSTLCEGQHMIDPLLEQAYDKVQLDASTLAAQSNILQVINQFCAHVLDNAFLPRPLSAFDDLPPLPDAYVLNEILCIYFEKLPPTIAIIHEDAFYKSASLPPNQDTTPMRPPYHHNPPRLGLSPVLLYSMMACAARYHPQYEGNSDIVRQVFYERGKRLMLENLGKPDLNLLKALLHLTLFGVEHSLWMEAYMWLGNSVAMGRFLGLYKEIPVIPMGPGGNGGIGAEEDLIGGLSLQQITAEESRRCWWWMRNYDASGSAASKRPQMISDAEYASTLLLPCPDSLFYATRYGLKPDTPVIPRTQTLDEFYSELFSADLTHSSIGPNGYIAALTALFNRVTRFRQQCNNDNILPFCPGPGTHTQLLRELERHQAELDMWYGKLPQWVQVLNSGVRDPNDPIVGGGMCWEEQWVRETYEWGIALVIWHATVATLHGPDYNMMTMGSQIVGSLQSMAGTQRPPSHITAGFMTAARLDEVLAAWQNSPSFGKAIEHAAVGSRLLEEMAARVEAKKRRDTPFFGYCVCQLGLLNLIAARQLALMQRTANPDETVASVLKHRATSSISILYHQSQVFSASKTGMQLLERVMTEIAGGEVTMRVMGELAREGRSGTEDAAVKEMLVRKAMGQTAQKVLEEPGQCAGTMGMGGQKFGTLL
ncbi:uncharacterized protein SPPG_06583 [Spizellomyces punctatus DAOM BR117]|uniref:Xylanolytic transcriptional activator regulatory domain-containing protein n=1 Tax=Spizellomyces punctatus (strain DAOM BR117) TaxID=645134 RepID=A0A0L0HBE5_SPIPD|nr:uncharacterized protein SPPG_06583 [Spizellomyces punctatus DAOM BR117]KNC98179.1 hypothetical protein SPPG_06583 [Spizellomyces punctatus DAOM BR117]|eukprot:XP_016606219.1 hypothetical protein SPPG_06583 [Spizellomyces punctatus DAOM BR117]